MIYFDMPKEKSNIIKVLGFGGGGSNAVTHMYRQDIQNVDFVICNTDAQALESSPVANKIQLGPNLTQGLGAGADPKRGKAATEESLEEIRRILEVNTKMAFITAGMGGGTGTGGAPTVARICQDLGILTVGIVTTPFLFEGPKRMEQAKAGIMELKESVDTLLVISNEKLRSQFGSLKMREAFRKADNVLSTAAKCITDIINKPGDINVDFADVCTVMKSGGVAILGSSSASGEERALKATREAINSPLLNDNNIMGAKWILLNITTAEGEHEYTTDEVYSIQQYVSGLAGKEANIILGMGIDEELGDAIGVTIIATGFHNRDPFEVAVEECEKTTAPGKPEETPIYMTLGIEGEEKKMEAVKVTVVPEVEMPPVEHNLVTPEDTDLTPKMDFTESDENQEAQTNSMDPVEDNDYFVLDFGSVINEEPATPVGQDDTPEETLPSFLQKPASVYREPEKEEPLNTAEEDLFTPQLQEDEMPVIEVKDEDEMLHGITMTVSEDHEETPQQRPVAVEQPDLCEEEIQKRMARERIERLRKLSFNPSAMDQTADIDNNPAYLRRDLSLHNSIANVEDFYSRANVKSNEDGETVISTLNNFLHGDKPD